MLTRVSHAAYMVRVDHGCRDVGVPCLPLRLLETRASHERVGEARVTQGMGRITLGVQPDVAKRLLHDAGDRARGEVLAFVVVRGGCEEGVGGGGFFASQGSG